LEHLLARLLTPPARLGAQAAVRVHPGVAFALFGADSARLDTRLELLANQDDVRLSQSRKDVTR